MQVLAPDKNWDRHVAQAELVARSDGFQALRDRVLERAAIQADEIVIDIGAGTGLLALAAAESADQVWAIDNSSRMCAYLATKARSAGAANIDTVVATAVSLPLVTGSVDVAVSNYCLHHLTRHEKRAALAELHRVVRPGGRIVLADMMFSVGLADPRDRDLIKTKSKALLAKGPAGAWRLICNGARFLAGRWERPESGEWWRRELGETGFAQVQLELTDHEGGIVEARR